MSENQLKIVMLESPYQTLLNNKEAQSLFSKMVELKIKGYKEMYQFGVLPLDASDFVATHLLVCRENQKDQNLEVLMGYKSTTLKTCHTFKIPFIIQEIIKKHGSNACNMELERILKDCEHRGEDISYDTSWTIHPKVREDKALQAQLKEMTGALLVHHHQAYKIRYWMTFGICKYKTDQYFLKLGAKELSPDANLLQPALFGTKAKTLICDTTNYSIYAKELAFKYQKEWANRVTLSANEAYEKRKAA